MARDVPFVGLSDFNFDALADQRSRWLVSAQDFLILFEDYLCVGFGVTHELLLGVREAALSVVESHDPN